MKHLSCACLPDKASEKKIQRLMEEVSLCCNSKKALAFSPHFSLRGDFKVEDNKLVSLLLDLGKALSKYSPLKLKLVNYGFYPWRIIYLDIEKNGPLQKLHEQIMRLVQKYRTNWIPEALEVSRHFSGKQREYVEKYGYHFAFEYFSPHFTLAGNDMEDSDFQKMKKKLANKKEKIEVTIDRVVLFDRENNNRVLKEFELKSI